MTLTRFGFQIPSFTSPGVDDAELFEVVVAAATTAEQSGFDSLWVMDHFHQIPAVGQATEPMLEAYTLLAGLAARTRSARIGALVTGVTYRNPALLAKMVTTLDIISGGRAVCGLGAAWFEAEHAAYGYEFPSVPERMDRLAEAVQICRAMFTGPEASRAGYHYQGHHYQIDGALNLPRPVTPGGPPILIGGGGERRTLKLVAEYADACNIFGDPETVRHKLAVLDEHCRRAGRDPAEITKTRLGALVLAGTAAEAARIGADLRATRNMAMDKYRGYTIEGDADGVVAQIQALFEAGLDGLIFNMSDLTDRAGIAEAGALLQDAFGSDAPPKNRR